MDPQQTTNEAQKVSKLQAAKELLRKEGYIISQTYTQKRDSAFNRFPLVFTLLGTFGLVATFYGFEKVMDEVGLSDHPYKLLATGIVILTITGSLYKKLAD